MTLLRLCKMVRHSGGLLSVLACAFTLLSCSSAVNAQKMEQVKPSMSVAQVEAILGRPAHIDQSETTGLRGEVYHYPSASGEGRVVFLNDAVFKAEFVPGGKV